MRIKIKNENRDCTKIYLNLQSINMNFACEFSHKPITTEDVLANNSCLIEFTDTHELRMFSDMLRRMQKECEDALGIWHRE